MFSKFNLRFLELLVDLHKIIGPEGTPYVFIFS